MSDVRKGPSGGDTILVAEDNEDHVMLIKRAFTQACLVNPVHVVSDGVAAIAYLIGEGKYADREQYPIPALVLLDLKMPNKDGFEVLEWIRRQPQFRNMRVVVLTTSDRIFDVQRAYELGADSFLTKPLDLRDFIMLGPAIKGFWVWSTDPNVKHPSPAGSSSLHNQVSAPAGEWGLLRSS